MIKKTIFLSIVFLVSFSFALAQETDLDVDIEEVEAVAAEELDIEEPGVVSWFKNAADTVKIWTTRDPVKKSELELKKASRQIVKARKLIKDRPDDAKLKDKLEKVNKKYGVLVDKVDTRIEKFKQEHPEETVKVKNFLDKYTDHQIKHQEVLLKLEEKVPEKAFIVIKENRERHLEKFGKVMNKLQDKEEFKKRLEHSLEGEEHIVRKAKRIEIIEELGEKDIPEEVKRKIRELKSEKQNLFRDVSDQVQEIERRYMEKKKMFKKEEGVDYTGQGDKRGYIGEDKKVDEAPVFKARIRTEVRDVIKDGTDAVIDLKDRVRVEVKEIIKKDDNVDYLNNKEDPIPDKDVPVTSEIFKPTIDSGIKAEGVK